MKPKILLFGATGVLGLKLLKHLKKININVNTAVCFKNVKLLKKYSSDYCIKNTFSISNKVDKAILENNIRKNKYDIIYFLDSNLTSFPLIISSLKSQRKCIYAIANKDLVIAGGRMLINKILSTSNFVYPLDSEHFSLIDLFSHNINSVKEVFITASGGPFYFTRKNLNKVTKKEVLNHPKWNMGKDITTNSSNFINKIFEIFELSVIYNLPLSKIDFLISKNALVHSVIVYNDGRYIFNAFKNDMLIPLIKPLEYFGYKKNFNTKLNLEDHKSFRLEYRKKDKRFKIFDKINIIKKFSHCEQINFLILNKKAQNLYFSNKLRYIDIIEYIFTNLKILNKNYKFRSLNDIVDYINNVNDKIK